MSNELTTTNQGSIINYTPEQIELIKKTIAKDATDLELQMFLTQCKRTGLDAITKQIYFIKNPKDGKVQIQTSIDGFRLIAERSEKYEGQTQPQWCGLDGVWKDVWFSNETLPAAARVGVWKKGFREPLYGVAIFEEYAQKKYDGSLTYMWDKMPALMISKVAESLALRKAFPNEMGGIYTQEEMAQATPSKEEPNSEQAPEKIEQPSAFENFKPKPLVLAPKADDRKALGLIVNAERKRLGWTANELSTFMIDSFGKPGQELSAQELEILIEALKKQEK